MRYLRVLTVRLDTSRSPKHVFLSVTVWYPPRLRPWGPSVLRPVTQCPLRRLLNSLPLLRYQHSLEVHLPHRKDTSFPHPRIVSNFTSQTPDTHVPCPFTLEFGTSLPPKIVVLNGLLPYPTNSVLHEGTEMVTNSVEPFFFRYKNGRLRLWDDKVNDTL